MSQPPRNKPPARRVSTGQPTGSRRAAYTNVPPRRDAFPFIMGGVIGALVVGLMLVLFLLVNRGNPAPAVPPATTDNQAAGGTLPTVAAGDSSQPTVEDAPRMALEDFKKLYDDPAKRPIIVDVRPVSAFEQGHIKGAISLPHSDIDARINELPKNKLIVAYCQ